MYNYKSHFVHSAFKKSWFARIRELRCQSTQLLLTTVLCATLPPEPLVTKVPEICCTTVSCHIYLNHCLKYNTQNCSKSITINNNNIIIIISTKAALILFHRLFFVDCSGVSSGLYKMNQQMFLTLAITLEIEAKPLASWDGLKIQDWNCH